MKRLLKDIRKYGKYVIYAAKADLTSEVANAYLDWFWWILEPVCNMFIYYVIFGLIFHNSEQYYLVFIYIGITLWTFFSKTMQNSVRLIKDMRGIISKVYIPKPMLLLTKMAVNFFKMLISFLITAIMMIPHRVNVSVYILDVFPILIVFLMFTYACATFLLHFGVYVDDLSYVVSIILNMLFYFTGVFYSVGTKFPQPFGYYFEKANPIAFFIAQMRGAMLYKEPMDGVVLFLWFIISTILSAIGTRLIYRNENSYIKVI